MKGCRRGLDGNNEGNLVFGHCRLGVVLQRRHWLPIFPSPLLPKAPVAQTSYNWSVFPTRASMRVRLALRFPWNLAIDPGTHLRH